MKEPCEGNKINLRNFGSLTKLTYLCALERRGARVVEEARLESVYTPKAYHGFESRSLRKKRCKSEQIRFTPFFVSRIIPNSISKLHVRKFAPEQHIEKF